MKKKKLVFHFYAIDNWDKNPIVKLHLKLLKHYAMFFDESHFVIAIDDINDITTIKAIEKMLMHIGYTNVKFSAIQNNPMLKQNETFYRDFILEMEHYDGVLYFGHLLGITRHKNNEPYEMLSKLICISYYELFKEIPYLDIIKAYCYMIIVPICYDRNDDGKWMSVGGFMGVNAAGLMQIASNVGASLKVNTIEECNNETFIGERISKDNADVCNANYMTLFSEWDYINYLDVGLNIIYSNNEKGLSEFNSFHEKFS